VALADAKMTPAEVLVDVRDALAWHRGQLPRALVADLPRHRAAVAALEGLVEQLGAQPAAEASP
jgi:ferric-dicitrate binding protein FerR (iron transport regulator)